MVYGCPGEKVDRDEIVDCVRREMALGLEGVVEEEEGR